jgi:hypothetical protein
MQALTQKNVEHVEKSGTEFERQMAVFLARYGADACAQSFITDAKVLLPIRPFSLQF